jgi:hypothetical protein
MIKREKLYEMGLLKRSKIINEAAVIGDEIRTKWGDGKIVDIGHEKVFVKLNNGKEVVIDKNYRYAENKQHNEAKTETKDIKAKNPGILDLPDNGFVDKTIEQLVKHVVKIAKDKGRSPVSKALQNLVRWNKNDNPSLSKKAQSVFDKYSKEMDAIEAKEKKESRNINEEENISDEKMIELSENEANEYKKEVSSDEMIKKVYDMLKNREIHPSGEFDKGGRWYAKNSDLINVRSPSRAWPYSQMLACRTLKYVKKVYDKYKPKNLKELISLV